MLRRRSIRLRIIALVLVPVLALLGLYVIVLNLTLGNLLTLKQEASIRQLVALPVASIQTQLGRERTLAVEYLAKPGRAGLDTLAAQEKKTDKAIRSYRAAVRTALRSGPVPKERQAFLAWQTALGRINVLRTAVDTRGGFTVADAAQAYSNLLDQGDVVLNQAIIPVLTGPLGIQAVDVLTMAKAAQAGGEESDIVRADLIRHAFPAADVTLIDQLIAQHTEDWAQTLPELDPNLQVYYHTMIPQGPARQIAQMETLLTSGPPRALKVSLPEWTTAEAAYQKGDLKTLLKCAAVLAGEATAQADGLAVNLLLIAGFGLLAIAAAVVVGLLLGRGLIRQLTDLKDSAVALSTVRLPTTIRRLRSGESVDVTAEVPRIDPGDDEISQVREAFNTAARPAISAAVDVAAIRRGVNDVFRSLARRNQSLLTRQLQLLDSMERRVHDPEDLADLFRVDHLTTRMRRHAEGLLIMAGGSSGRAWREPVPVVDVMRAAVAEVEDYTRIRVTSRTSAAIAGHAVADIIHLLAELVENATTFSPANTPVRIDGDKVARGVVVEIEDRGLGMGEPQLAAANTLVQDPPMFDLSGSDQLGLFIAGQLAQRHDVKVSLRESPYGGIVAVVLIPRSLTIDLDESDEPPSAPFASIRELGGRPVPELPVAASEAGVSGGYLVGAEAHHRTARLANRVIGQPAPTPVPAPVAAPPPMTTPLPIATPAPVTPPVPARVTGSTGWPVPSDLIARSSGLGGAGQQPAARDPFSPPAGQEPAAPGAAADAEATVPGTADPVFHGAPASLVAQGPDGPAGSDLPTREPLTSGLIWNEHGIGLDRDPVRPVRPAWVAETNGGAPGDDEFPIALPTDMVDLDGLPMRVKQANLAPQLRRQTVVVQPEPANPEPEPSPDAARNTMAALQLGWERGRSAPVPAPDYLPAPTISPQDAGDPAEDDAQEDRS